MIEADFLKNRKAANTFDVGKKSHIRERTIFFQHTPRDGLTAVGWFSPI